MPFQTKIRSLYQLLELIEDRSHPEFINEIRSNPAATIRGIIEEPSADEFKDHITSIRELEEKLRTDSRLLDLFKHDPESFIRKMVKEAPQPEYKIYRILVGSLCAVVIIIILGVLAAWLTKNSREAPTLITAVACTTLGLLAGIFVSVPGKGMKNTQGAGRS
ncbi:MAG: hypothetical protein WCF67_14270 [Chitinophagaceae bacterium]